MGFYPVKQRRFLLQQEFTMSYYTIEQIEKARSIDLLTYLQTYEPTELVHIRGDTYCTREHDSLKISNGKWMWWSRGFGGRSALDYLVKVKGMSFTDAMKLLTKGAGLLPTFNEKIGKKQIEKRLLMPEKSDTNDHIIRYLTGRGIDENLINACIHRDVLYESELYHNCVFIGHDENGIARYGGYRSTNDLKMMGDLAGSDKRYSFRTNSEGNDLHVFESPIDLLSYMTLMNMKTGRWLAEPMLSLGGVYKPSGDPSKRRVPVALQNMLENHPEVTTVHLHLDNDTAGRAAACSIEDQLKNRYNVRLEFPPRGKDCNDYLMHMRKQKLS